jgi:hypothetical protein
MKYTREICQHFVIPEPKNYKSLFAKPGITDCLPLRLNDGMLATINLDDESRLRANEVHDVRTDRKLPPERKALKAVRAKATPNASLRRRHLAPKFSSP